VSPAQAWTFALLSHRLDRQVRSTPGVDARVADAMMAAGRHRFVGWHLLDAFRNGSPCLGFGQYLGQPTFVAELLTAARIAPSDRILDVGTGSGFTAAVASRLGREVLSVERIPELAARARENLARAGIANVTVVLGDAWHSDAVTGVFDVILINAGAPRLPETAFASLAAGGRLIVPVGDRTSEGAVVGRLLRVTLSDGAPVIEDLRHCAFVPLIGAEGWPESAEPPEPRKHARVG